VAGDSRRAPVWMQRTGLEWAHRLASEPGRLGRRYLREDAPFAVRLLATSALRRDRVSDEDEFFALLTPDEGRAWNASNDEPVVPDHVASAVTLEVPPVLETAPAEPERRRPRPSPRPHR
jgi:hypothetical protein